MRTKLIFLVAALCAFLIGGGTADAALQNAVKVKSSFKKAGGPGSLTLQLINIDDAPLPVGKSISQRRLHRYIFNGGLVPQPIKRVVVSSRAARYNRHALPYCKVYFNGRKTIPTRADGITGTERLTYVPRQRNSRSVSRACPKKSIIGRGNFTATIGTPGMAYQPVLAGVLEGSVIAYNYQPKRGDTLGTVVRLHVKRPVPSTLYLYVGVSKRGVIDAKIPTRADIPPNLDAALLPGAVSLTSVDLKLTAPKPKRRHGKRGKPIFTIKSFRKLDFYGQIIR